MGIEPCPEAARYRSKRSFVLMGGSRPTSWRTMTGDWYVVGFAFAGVSFVFLTIALAWLLSHRNRGDRDKGVPYESGIDTYGDTWGRFGISFYIYALLFVAFDVEVVFLFMWAIVFRDLLIGGLVSMGTFIVILLLGLAYAWRKGVLTWR
jgi:NADH:ubiquinone oxidoreductase subunit 3 (subunit A)